MNREVFDPTGATVVEFPAPLGAPTEVYDLEPGRGYVECDYPISVKVKRPGRVWNRNSPVTIAIRLRTERASRRRSSGDGQLISNSYVGGDVTQVRGVKGSVNIISSGGYMQPRMPQPPKDPFVIHLPRDMEGKLSFRAKP